VCAGDAPGADRYLGYLPQTLEVYTMALYAQR
jgi:hypothetical protein